MRLGVDLGGTKTEVIVLDDGGVEVFRRRRATPSKTYEPTLEGIVALIHEAEQEVGEQCTVGLGTPGSLSPATGLLRNSNTVALNGKPFKQDLEAMLGREIRVANDANCFALSEAVDGAGRGADTVFGVIIGTGTGGGVVLSGRTLIGANAVGGEWGHNPLPWPRDDERPGPECYCGRHGCMETWVSGPGLARDFRSLGGPDIPAREIVELAHGSDDTAELALRRYEDRLARGLATVINVVDPDVIVLGGGMGNVQRLYRTVPELWREHVFSDVIATRLTPPVHGDSGGVRGAAWLWGSAASD